MTRQRSPKEMYLAYLEGKVTFEELDRASEEFLAEYQRAKQQAADARSSSDAEARRPS